MSSRWMTDEQVAAHQSKFAATPKAGSSRPTTTATVTAANPLAVMAGQCLDAAIKSHKGNKYSNVPTIIDGIRFASRKEAKRWGELKLLEQAGAITHLERQTKFSLDVNGVHIANYIADFEYIDAEGKRTVEDAKGYWTPAFKLKAKLMLACHSITLVVT